MRSWQPFLVDGLLQTPTYADVLFHGNARRVEGRIDRQAILARPEPPRLICVMPEIVLWNQVGTAEVMHQQLLHLAEAITPRISVQIIPNGAPHPGHFGAFLLARLPGGNQIAYADSEPHGRILDGRSDIDALSERFSDLATYALPAEQSGALIRQTAEERWKT